MAEARMKIAKLDEAQLAEVEVLEKELGCYLVGIEPQFRLAELTQEQLSKIQDAENSLGVVLLAYEPV